MGVRHVCLLDAWDLGGQDTESNLHLITHKCTQVINLCCGLSFVAAYYFGCKSRNRVVQFVGTFSSP